MPPCRMHNVKKKAKRQQAASQELNKETFGKADDIAEGEALGMLALAADCCSRVRDDVEVSRATRAAMRPKEGAGLVCT